MKNLRLSACKQIDFKQDGTKVTATLMTYEGKIFEGKAKYNPEDDAQGYPFSLDFGQKLAELRAKDKLIDYNWRKCSKARAAARKEFQDAIQKIEKIEGKNEKIDYTVEKGYKEVNEYFKDVIDKEA